jgi:hypothetical protein
MHGDSNVGTRTLYEEGDQRNVPQSEIKEAERLKEGKPNSHLPQDSKDERTIANRLDAETRRKESDNDDIETMQSKKDATLPARSHGNEPSKGAKIDQELREEEEEIMKKKGSFGPKK